MVTLVNVDDEIAEIRELCFAPDPMTAWSLSGQVHGEPHTSRGCKTSSLAKTEDETQCREELSHWDLWQVFLQGWDEVHFLPNYGPFVSEIRLRTPVPRSRLWLVGTRTVPPGRRRPLQRGVRPPFPDKQTGGPKFHHAVPPSP